MNSCSGKINELLYKDSLAIDLISEIYQNKKILIPQRINDIIITYFRNIIKKLRKYKINQKYILLSDYMRLATNAASFINNLEKSTKIKVIDKTSNQTIDMIILSILNNLQQTKEGRFIHQNHLSLFHHNKRNILLANIDKTKRSGHQFHVENFSSISLEKFIKRDIFQWTTLSMNKSVNPIGQLKVKQVLNTYKTYLKNKIPGEFKNSNSSNQVSLSKTRNKYTKYINKRVKEVSSQKQNILLVTGDTILSSLEILNIRGNWIRKSHLQKKIIDLSGLQDNKIASADTRFAIINLILLHGHMEVMGHERAYIKKSNFQEGFLLHPEYH